jgi:hypothetical protein
MGDRAAAADVRQRRGAALAGGDGQVGVLQVPGAKSGTEPTQTSYVVVVPAKSTIAR